MSKSESGLDSHAERSNVSHPTSKKEEIRMDRLTAKHPSHPSSAKKDEDVPPPPPDMRGKVPPPAAALGATRTGKVPKGST